jgi:hypothetical protein
MKNALDDIECIPTSSNLNPPYQIISHPYCIDIISTYVALSKLDFNNKNEVLDIIKENIEYYCKSNNINFAYHFDNKLPLIISTQTNNFQWFLGLQIIGFDINKIKALLSFQQKRYNNDEIDFVTFVEFAIYNLVKNFTIINNSDRLKIIMDWVYQQRMSSTANQKQSVNKLAAQKIVSIKENKKKSIEPSFQIIGLITDSSYFINNANILLEVFKLLKGGGFISYNTTYNNFKNILSGERINRETRIDWTGKQKDLNRFILLLTREYIIKKIKYKWETACNCFTINEKDFLPEMIRKSNGKNENEHKLKAIVKLLKDL